MFERLGDLIAFDLPVLSPDVPAGPPVLAVAFTLVGWTFNAITPETPAATRWRKSEPDPDSIHRKAFTGIQGQDSRSTLIAFPRVLK